MGLAVCIEEGQAVETLVVLREAPQTEKQSPDTHLHQHSFLIRMIWRQGFGHFYHLSGGLGLLLTLAGRGLGGGLLRRCWLWRCGWHRHQVRTGVRRDFGS